MTGRSRWRLVPGRHEGDLIMGSVASNSAIGTVVERTTGSLSLIHLPDGHDAEAVADALTATRPATRPATLPAGMVKTLTWDRGRKMAQHARFTAQTGITVYFADPYAPWQRGSNKNINGLLPEYFPKRSDLSSHRPEALAAVAQQLNNRPRKRLGFLTPAQVIAKLITEDQPAGVATID